MESRAEFAAAAAAHHLLAEGSRHRIGVPRLRGHVLKRGRTHRRFALQVVQHLHQACPDRLSAGMNLMPLLLHHALQHIVHRPHQAPVSTSGNFSAGHMPAALKAAHRDLSPGHGEGALAAVLSVSFQLAAVQPSRPDRPAHSPRRS